MDFADIKNKALPFLDFQDDEVYIALILRRKKYDKEFQRSSRVLHREVLDRHAWEDKLLKLYTLLKNHPYKDSANLYLMINPRSARKGIRNIKNKMTVWDYDQTYEPYEHFTSHWFSSLQKKSARSRREWYIVDIDDVNKEVVQQIEDDFFNYISTDYKKFETRNGFHIVSKPFNVQRFYKILNKQCLDDFVEIKTDDCLFLMSGLEDEKPSFGYKFYETVHHNT